MAESIEAVARVLPDGPAFTVQVWPVSERQIEIAWPPPQTCPRLPAPVEVESQGSMVFAMIVALNASVARAVVERIIDKSKLSHLTETWNAAQ